MKLSKLNIKKINLNDIDNNYVGQDILMKLGELYQFESGIYAYGNILNKLERIIEEIIIDEFDKFDCIQVEFPELQPKKIWTYSGRWNTFTADKDTMFTVDTNLGEYGLAPTAEECATLFGANRLSSYKNLPAIYYQINNKFRKEIRTRGYLFRARIFKMLDAYSFDKNEDDMHTTYYKMNELYMKLFKRLGINIIPVVSDGGTMGGRVSTEFQVLTNMGEDIILYDKENNVGLNKEVLDFDDKEIFLKSFGISDINNLMEYHSLELGNNFELGTKYSDNMKAYYIDEQGDKKSYYMGCYGIGIGRIMATIIENNVIRENNTIKGFVLPYNLSPYKIQIIYTDDNKDIAFNLYNYLNNAGIKAIIDDRTNLSIGSKIQDVYVLGTPKFMVIGNKFNGNNYEIEDSKTNKKKIVKYDEIINELKKE